MHQEVFLTGLTEPPAYLSSALHTPRPVSHRGSPKVLGPVLLKTTGLGQPYLQSRVYPQEAN